MKKILFITASDIFDPYGNGGSKGSRKNYDLLIKKFGKKNVFVVLLTLSSYSIDQELGENLICIPQPEGNIQNLVASLFGYKNKTTQV